MIQVNPSIDEAQLHLSSKAKILVIPAEDFFDSPSAKHKIMHWLVGHELHPHYNSTVLTKPSPSEAHSLKAFVSTVDSGTKGFLNIMPDGLISKAVLAEALKAKLRMSSTKKISLVTADRVDAVDELHREVKSKLSRLRVDVLNWNDFSNKEFVAEMNAALQGKRPIVFVMTINGLRKLLGSLNKENYVSLSANLDAVYVEGAHHLSGSQTHLAFSELLNASSAFLYGLITTSAHAGANLKNLFTSEYWSYLDDAQALPAPPRLDWTLKQLALGIEQREITPFDDVYLVGEPNFELVAEQPLFVRDEEPYWSLNPIYYSRLGQILSPIFSVNKKGIIVAATTEEAKGLRDFFTHAFKDIYFETYLWEVPLQERENILFRSENEEAYYIIVVRNLDESIQLPHLSAYIDLNPNSASHQKIRRVGSVLQLWPGKAISDILFLSDYRDEEKKTGLIDFISEITKYKFHPKLTRHEDRADKDQLTRAQLLKTRQVLEEFLRN